LILFKVKVNLLSFWLYTGSSGRQALRYVSGGNFRHHVQLRRDAPCKTVIAASTSNIFRFVMTITCIDGADTGCSLLSIL
jgi:hypothetical protein